ncbi:MAG: M24 family metallopeptidase [Dysgonomonas sp.]
MNTLSEDIIIRKSKLQAKLQESDIDACLLTTNVNLFYLTGLIYTGYYYLPKEGKPIHFVKRPNDIDLENTVYIRKPEQIVEELQKRGLSVPATILLETDSVPYSECNRIISSLENPKVENASTLMRTLRSIKTEFELSQVRECAKQHETVYSLIPTLYKKGMTDLQLQVEIEKQMRLHGSIGIFRSYGENMDIYMGSLLVGENAETPSPFDFALGGQGVDPSLPLGCSNIEIEKGQTIMVDMAGNYRPWMTDMTRVFSFGKTSALAYKAHQVSIDIHNEIIETAKAGTSCSELYEIAMKYVKGNDLEEYFMGTKQQAKFVGHGVGLEINEPPVLTPRSKETLKANIVFALEPKFVIPNIGAVGIENTYIVHENGLEKATVFEESIIEL